MKNKVVPTAGEIYSQVVAAESRIRPHILETALEFFGYLSEQGQCRVYLKLENMQLTGSFKLRGAFNRLLALTAEEKKRGIVTASTGNHAAAVAFALKKLDIPGTIFVPRNISGAKLDILRSAGISPELYGMDTAETEAYARKMARRRGQVYVSPYNDPRIIGGQGTVGMELTRRMQNIDAVFLPVGGGGLASGVAGYLKHLDPGITIIGCQPENSPVMAQSVKAGKIIDMESLPTLADGTAGGIEPGALTFDICKNLVDEFVLVSEAEIAEAVRLMLDKSHILAEGAAALPVACFVKVRERYRGKNVVLVITGRKIGYENLKKTVCSAQVRK